MSITDLEEARAAIRLPRDGSVNGRSLAERAASGETSTYVDPQDGLFDVILENESLERALEHRQSAKDALKPKQKTYDEANEAVKGIVAGLDLGEVEEGDEQVFRCGRFRIKRKHRAGNAVSFETSPSTRTTISLIKE